MFKEDVESYLKLMIDDVNKCYNELIEPYFDKSINMINTSLLTKKEKDEFVNKINCLLVQKHCYQEILDKLQEKD